MRNGLYMFRHGKRLTQEEFAEKLGYTRQSYSAIEKGKHNGSVAFWTKLQTAFGIPDAELGGLMRNE